MTLLPAASAAIVEERKVRAYLLDPQHPGNGGKAALFAAFGFSPNAWPILQAALMRHAADNEVVATQASSFGTKFRVVCHMQTPDGRDPCLTTIWFSANGAPPRLVTAYK